MDSLKKSYKGKYLFRLGTTSFIYPDLYSANVRKLGSFVDEVELLFFESRHPDSLPKEYEILELARLKTEYDLTYNIHLPTDVSIADPDPAERLVAVDAISRVIDVTSILGPVTYTLHVPYEPNRAGGYAVWQAYSFKGLRTLLQNGMDSRLLSIETLDYPPEMLSDLVEEFDLSVCLDIGHMIVHGYDPVAAYHRFKNRVSIIHLHGVHNGCDHVSLDLINPLDFQKVRTILEDFSGTVSLEVFSLSDLEPSLEFLAKHL